ncbi:MAG TPA: sensor histidine kinase [Myxococcales bacterium]|nr:sensor histidine kinase [Myxococcales bacterium]
MRARRSLRYQLLLWLLIPLAGLCLVGATLARLTVRGAIDAAYDKSLHAAALAISEHLRMEGQRPQVDIPPVALEMLDTVDQDRVFYSVSYRSADGRSVFITGYDDLPRPPDAAAARGKAFYDADYRGDRIRVAALYTAMPADPPLLVVTQVAETVRGRTGLIQTILAQAMGQQLFLLVFGGVIVWIGVTRGLAPLRDLSNEVARRTASDLEPLPPHHAPEEVSPLIAAIDQLMSRVRDAIALQRRFIADASHQLRTPLAVLRTQAESALREQEPAAVREALAHLRDHSQATSHLASQLLSLARAEPAAELPVEAELVDLVSVAREACTALVPEALSRRVDLGFEEEGPAPIRAQALLVRELIGNLVDNALRYAPRGTITVRVARPGPAFVSLVVEDDGPGIPPEERGRVFDRFYRIRGTQGDGAGLGLAIVREIARRHGGTVSLADGPGGKGLRVEVRFPRLEREARGAS